MECAQLRTVEKAAFGHNRMRGPKRSRRGAGIRIGGRCLRNLQAESHSGHRSCTAAGRMALLLRIRATRPACNGPQP